MGMSFLTASTFSSAMRSRRWASLRASFCSVSEMASLPCWEILRRYSSVRAIIMASCRRLTCICQYESWSRSSQSRILFNSMSTPPRAFRASSVKVTSATRKSFRDWIDRTFADSDMGCVLVVARNSGELRVASCEWQVKQGVVASKAGIQAKQSYWANIEAVSLISLDYVNSPLATRLSPLATRHSPLATRHYSEPLSHLCCKYSSARSAL